MDDLLSTPPPALAAEEVVALLWERFGLRGSLEPLPGERDQNFRVRTDAASYVLKIHNAEEDPAVVEAQDQALRHIAARAPELPVPRVMPPRDGSAPRTEGRIVRLLSWVEGTPMHLSQPLSRDVLDRLGGALGALDRALCNFTHPGSETPLLWDIQHALDLRPMLEAIPDSDVADLAARTLDLLESKTFPAMAGLPRQVIHNDANPHNVLIDGGAVSGILDFGDMVRAPRVQELAVAATYHLGSEPMSAMVSMARGYHGASPLTSAELAVVPALVAARCVATVAIGSWRLRLMGGDGRYILKNYGAATSGLRALWPILSSAGAALAHFVGAA